MILKNLSYSDLFALYYHVVYKQYELTTPTAHWYRLTRISNRINDELEYRFKQHWNRVND